ncbi:argininosuccinate lyase, partial [Candidatus Woesearchaeota archaeon]|nr:argininosuccinate lyase [Candidatus Woesearchaeota archaeon]
MKLWETEDTKINKEIEKFTVGEDYNIDMSIIVYDCKASIAHAKMLHKMGILSKGELTQLVDALNVIIGLVKAGHFQIKIEDEDCHTAIENFLVAKLGKLGEKIHTFRSRNDQVVTALRLYYKDEISKVIELVNELIEGLLIFKNRFIGVKLPGYTHTRKAMPSSIGIWCDSFIASMEDNKALLGFVKTLIDQSPLGTGAGYGLPVSIDRSFLAEQLGFKKVQHSPLYVQNSRGKFEATI